MEVADIVLIAVISIAMAVSLYFLWQYLPGNAEEFRNIVITNDTFPPTNGMQFYSNMRYADATISFNIGRACDEKKTQDALNAFAILENGTLLQFYQVQGKGQVQILCSDIAPDSNDAGHFIAGEGGPKEIIISGQFHVIKSGQVSLFKTDNCQTPNIATHEILHALGFDHNNTDSKSIMFPITSCSERVDKYIKDEINRLYSVPSLPDLAITNANATKNGPYLSFELGVENIGLRDIFDATLSIYNQNGKISNQDHSLGGISIGEKKKLTVQNAMIPRDSSEIRFIVSMGNSSDELSLDNNQVVLSPTG